MRYAELKAIGIKLLELFTSRCTGWLPKFRRNLLLSSLRYKTSLLVAVHQKKWPHSLIVMRTRNLQTTCFNTTNAQTHSTFQVYCPFKA
jgi:hypothetical protein